MINNPTFPKKNSSSFLIFILALILAFILFIGLFELLQLLSNTGV